MGIDPSREQVLTAIHYVTNYLRNGSVFCLYMKNCMIGYFRDSNSDDLNYYLVILTCSYLQHAMERLVNEATEELPDGSEADPMTRFF